MDRPLHITGRTSATPQLVTFTVGVSLQGIEMEQRNSRQVAAQKARPTTGARRTAMRVVHRKSQGVLAVYEQDPVASEAGTRTLVFESITGCARIVDFPAHWQLLSDEELLRLRRTKS
jgi:hypothetical protein